MIRVLGNDTLTFLGVTGMNTDVSFRPAMLMTILSEHASELLR